MTGGHGGSSGGHSSGGHSSSAGHSSGHAAGSCHTGSSTHTTAAAPATTTGMASTGSAGSSSSSSLSSGHNMTTGSGSDPVQTDSNQGQQSGGMMQGIKDTMAGIFGGSKSSTDASQQQGQAGTASQSSHQTSGSTTTTTTASNPPGSAAGMTHTTGTDAANAQPKDIYLQGIKTFDPAQPNVTRAAQQKGTEAVNNASNSSMSSNSSSSMSSSSMSSSSMSSHPTSSTTTTHTTGSMMGAHHNDSGVTGMAAGSGASTISSQGFKHDTMNFDGKDLNATNRPTGIRPVGASDSTTMAAPSQ